jgi:hypothetical protein
MSLSADELAAIRRRVELASTGWYVHTGRRAISVMQSNGQPPNDADADFIAHARSDVPALLAEVDRLAGEVARLTEGRL